MPDLEFHVEKPSNTDSDTQIFSSFKDAAAYAVEQSGSRGRKTYIDVVVWSRAGAKKWGGSYAVEQYNEDPEASVFERIEVSVNLLGRIP